jgi:hypothetical protein
MTSIINDIETPSICIPRVFANISEQRVRAIFNNLAFGDIQQIDMVHKTNSKGEQFQRVFIHFSSWNHNDQIDRVRLQLLAKQPVQIVYDDPWFWKLSASTSIRPELRTSRPKRPTPRIQFISTDLTTDYPTTDELVRGC